MPRKGPAPKRALLPDPIYGSTLVTRFINRMMHGGKKSISEKIFYRALEIVEERMKRPGIEVFEQAVKNVMPIVEVKARRVGGATYQVPIEVRSERRLALALRWMITFARRRSGKTMIDKLAGEIGDAAQNQGQSVRRREETHRMAEANKAFSHYRW
ncbi:MAG: 30S ribosomal protein S7 [Armatimonadetes bacterium]|nr:30S ribosomal protein S7 [Armatimonadota bacterium]